MPLLTNILTNHAPVENFKTPKTTTPTHPKKEKERYDLLHQYDDPHCLLLSVSVSVSLTHVHAHSERQTKCNTLNAQSFHPKETKLIKSSSKLELKKEKKFAIPC
jgi:hypothetical protein